MCTTEIGVLGRVLVFIQLLSVSRFTSKVPAPELVSLKGERVGEERAWKE